MNALTAKPIGYKVRDLVALTGTSERTLRRWIADGRLDVVRVGKSVYVKPESVHALFGVER